MAATVSGKKMVEKVLARRIFQCEPDGSYECSQGCHTVHWIKPFPSLEYSRATSRQQILLPAHTAHMFL